MNYWSNWLHPVTSVKHLSLSHTHTHAHHRAHTQTHTHTQRNQLHTSRHLKIIYLLIFTEILNCSQFTWHKDALMSQTALKHTTHARTRTHTPHRETSSTRHLKIIYLLIFTEILNCSQFTWHKDALLSQTALKHTHTNAHTHTHTQRNQLHTSRHLKIIYLLIFTEILNCSQFT